MIGKKIRFLVLSSVLAFSLLSCVTGNYMNLRNSEKADTLGMVKTTFDVTGAFRYRRVINNLAYMNLLDEAQKEYSGIIDIRDISWAIGKSDTANNNFEYAAIGTVIRK